jgi:RNA polymerase sigma-70 factor (ECF subfamily)
VNHQKIAIMFILSTNSPQGYDFKEYLLANMNSMYNLALRLTGNREEAGDLVQEASLRAYRYYDQFQPGTNFKAWILTIVRNLFINQYRKKRREPPFIHMDQYENPENFVPVPAMSGCEEEVFSEHIHLAVEKLPEELRTAVILYFVEGLSYKEISQVMDCPMGTVMSWQSTRLE